MIAVASWSQAPPRISRLSGSSPRSNPPPPFGRYGPPASDLYLSSFSFVEEWPRPAGLRGGWRGQVDAISQRRIVVGG
jgi:hypothetical protein